MSVIAINAKEFDESGCPYCGCRYQGSPIFSCDLIKVFQCSECLNKFVVLSKDVEFKENPTHTISSWALGT